MLAPSLNQASLMLRQFRVDVIVAFGSGAEDLRPLSKLRTPLIVVTGEQTAVSGVKCAAFISDRLDCAGMAAIVMRVMKGERGIHAAHEPAPPHAEAAAYETDHSRRR